MTELLKERVKCLKTEIWNIIEEICFEERISKDWNNNIPYFIFINKLGTYTQ